MRICRLRGILLCLEKTDGRRIQVFLRLKDATLIIECLQFFVRRTVAGIVPDSIVQQAGRSDILVILIHSHHTQQGIPRLQSTIGQRCWVHPIQHSQGAVRTIGNKCLNVIH